VLGCLLGPVSVLAVWTASQVSDTSAYVATMAPVISEPAIQHALTDKITHQITARLDVAAAADQAANSLDSRGLPRVGALLKNFAPSISSAVTGVIHTQVQKFVTSPAAAKLWVRANTVGHAQLVKALSGQGSKAITVQNGIVTLNLGPIIDAAKQRLAARGLGIVTRLPAINPTFPLFSAKYLVKAQTAYRALNDLEIILPLAAVFLLTAGVYVARNHRRAVIGAGLGLAASMLVLAIGLLVFRGIYLNSIPPAKLPADAAAALFDNLVRFIRYSLRTVLVVGLVLAGGAFLTGPSSTAVRIRSSFASALGWLRRRAELAGLRTGPVGQWAYAHRTALRIGATAVAALVFVFWGRPTPTVVIVIVVLLLVALGLVELIGRPPADAGETTPSATGMEATDGAESGALAESATPAAAATATGSPPAGGGSTAVGPERAARLPDLERDGNGLWALGSVDEDDVSASQAALLLGRHFRHTRNVSGLKPTTKGSRRRLRWPPYRQAPAKHGSACSLRRSHGSYAAHMSTSPLSPEDIRAAAEVHRELGPEYSDAVVASFLEKIDREITARVDARIAATPQAQRAQPAEADNRRALIKGIAIGTFVTGSTLLAAMSGNGDEGKRRLVLVLVIWLALALGYGVSAARARRHS
jgi:hypothetical protein